MSTESAQEKFAEIIRQETDNFRTVIEFLESTKNGEVEDATLADRVEAERLLEHYGPMIEELNWAAPEAE